MPGLAEIVGTAAILLEQLLSGIEEEATMLAVERSRDCPGHCVMQARSEVYKKYRKNPLKRQPS